MMVVAVHGRARAEVFELGSRELNPPTQVEEDRQLRGRSERGAPGEPSKGLQRRFPMGFLVRACNVLKGI